MTCKCYKLLLISVPSPQDHAPFHSFHSPCKSAAPADARNLQLSSLALQSRILLHRLPLPLRSLLSISGLRVELSCRLQRRWRMSQLGTIRTCHHLGRRTRAFSLSASQRDRELARSIGVQRKTRWGRGRTRRRPLRREVGELGVQVEVEVTILSCSRTL